MTQPQTTAIHEDDLIGCEICDKICHIDDASMLEEGWMCPACAEQANAAFKSCKHEWKSEIDQFGDDAYYCHKCHHQVAKDYIDAR